MVKRKYKEQYLSDGTQYKNTIRGRGIRYMLQLLSAVHDYDDVTDGVSDEGRGGQTWQRHAHNEDT